MNKSKRDKLVIQEEPEESSPDHQGTQKTWEEGQEDEYKDDDTVREALEKAETITNQISKIHELQNNLEEATHEISKLRKLNEDIGNEKDELALQVKILQEKRESGLQEIQKLNAYIERIKSDASPLVNKLSIEKNPSNQSNLANTTINSIQEQALSPTTSHKHSKSIAEGSGKKSIKGSRHLSAIKKNLEVIYKEVILALTSVKMASMQKQPANPGEEDLGDSLVKVEKKVNDTILLLQEYIEAITRL